MEVFSLLKFWRNAAGTDSFTCDAFSDADFSTSSSYDFRNQLEEEFDDEDSFFDLVFPSPDRDTQQTKCAANTVKINDDFGKTESNLNGNFKSNFMESPTDVFYKKPQSPISILKSSPKLRVFMLGFSKSKLVKSQVSCASMADNVPTQPNSSKRFTVDCEIEEVPIASLLTRDNSLRAKLTTEKLDDSSSTDEQSKTNKYLNLIKPLYVKSSKRYTDKTKFSEQSPSSSLATAPALSPKNPVDEKQGNRTTVFRKVSKHLGKSRSESRSIAGKVNPSPTSKSDDSALQQQDGIQGAILHCKKSFNASSYGCFVLARSDSAPAQGKSINQPRISVEEKRSSI